MIVVHARLAAFICTNSSDSNLECTIMSNATFPHALPLHVNVLDNALLQALTNNPIAFIDVIDSPLPLTDDEEVRLAFQCF